MKKIIVLSIVLSYAAHTFGQNQKEVNLIQVDSTWGKEIIQIPFWFAPKIGYEGYEDIRFAKGWENIDSSGFWTLVFAWDINLKKEPTTAFFEDNLEQYFDGLMKVVNENTTVIIPKTTAFFKADKTKQTIKTFTGTLETYDAFTTEKMITLYVTIESYYCKKSKKHMPFFRFSPKSFEHEVWRKLNSIKLLDTICNHS